jgi:hypothetical protein
MLDFLFSVVMNVLGAAAEPLNDRYRDGRPLLAKKPRPAQAPER